VAALGKVSRVLGRSDPAYRVAGSGHALVAYSRPQRLAARFGPAGAVVRSGAVTIRVRPAGYGYGGRLDRVRPVRPVAVANRVVYRAGPLTAWYTNGPAGLEQGFTLAAAPRLRGHVQENQSRPSLAPGQAGLAARRGALTLALSVAGTARASLAGGGVTFRAGRSALAYRDLVARDARGRRLRAWLSLAPGRLLLHVDVAGAGYPVVIDPVFQQLATLTVAGGGTGDAGWSVAVSGQTIVAGAPAARVGGNRLQGAVYVFTEPAGGWADATQTATLTASDGAIGDLLGYSVAIGGNTIVAGAPEATENTHLDQGAAYVFVRPPAVHLPLAPWQPHRQGDPAR
jgi:hypothetical protein